MSGDPAPAPETGKGTETGAPTVDSVEGVVRAQLAKALGGRRGMVEAAVPTILFTVTFVTTQRLATAVALSVAVAVVLLVVRVVQRSQVQFVVNSLVGIGIGALFAYRGLRSGGDSGEAPGLLPARPALQRRLRRGHVGEQPRPLAPRRLPRRQRHR